MQSMALKVLIKSGPGQGALQSVTLRELLVDRNQSAQHRCFYLIDLYHIEKIISRKDAELAK